MLVVLFWIFFLYMCSWVIQLKGACTLYSKKRSRILSRASVGWVT
jgi:hypothetical protein